MKQTETTTQTTPDFAALVPKLIDQVRSLRDQIPGFTLPHPSHTELRGPAANVPQPAVDAAIAASLAHKALAESIDAAEVQSDEDFARYFADLRDELNILFTGIDYTIRLKRFTAGQATLNVLSIARRLAQKAENAYLKAHIEAIEKGLHRRRRNSKPSEPQPAPQG